MENLQDCANLQELNLSGNEIGCIEGLERLHHLRKLVLTSNQIESLDGLQVHWDMCMHTCVCSCAEPSVLICAVRLRVCAPVWRTFVSLSLSLSLSLFSMYIYIYIYIYINTHIHTYIHNTYYPLPCVSDKIQAEKRDPTGACKIIAHRATVSWSYNVAYLHWLSVPFSTSSNLQRWKTYRLKRSLVVQLFCIRQ